MKVLVACEMSGRVREAFRKKGHDAWSCDLIPSLDNSPYHVVGNATSLLEGNWDLLIAHPPCTYLCNSGVWALKLNDRSDVVCTDIRWPGEQFDGDRYLEMQHARALFMSFWESSIPKICVENPIPHKYANLPKYTQTIQPYQFGEDASKRTCLWLKGLPLLIGTNYIPPVHGGDKKVYANQTPSGQNKEGPSENRGALRSLTYQGIADAFADQWG